MAEIERLDRYTVLVNGHCVRANENTEATLRQMDDEQIERFLAIMGVDR